MNNEHDHNYPLSKKILFAILPFFISNLQRLLALTCKKVYILPQQATPMPSVWVGWHGQLIVLNLLYTKVRSAPYKINVLVSGHIHGDLAINSVKRYKFGFIRGSSRKGAVRALLAAIDSLKKGWDVGITPDGPKGPVYSVSDGAIILSQKCDAPVIACGWSASSFWQLKSWDKARIPKPFSTITFKISEPLYLKGKETDEAKNIIKNAIMECMKEDHANKL